jgi:rhamnosyltransferase
MARIAPQVGHIVIVDNHSGEEDIHMLRALCKAEKAELIENKENLGIATALNQGIKRVTELGYEWVVTLDQDTIPEFNLIQSLSKIYSSHPDRERIRMVGSNYRSPVTGQVAVNCSMVTSNFVETSIVITSCCLIPLKAFGEVGAFRDDFFIDQVDHEYCLRLRSHGYKVIMSCKPLMVHSVGDQTVHRFISKQICTNHSPLRRYYITRNRLVLYKTYICKDGNWVLRSFFTSMRELIMIILFEDHKFEKLRAVALGILHAFSGKMGKLQGNRLENY